MRRREFVTILGGAAAAWPLAAGAQQDARMRRVGMLVAAADNDPDFLARIAAFGETLTRLGWVEGRNLRTELRFGTGDTDRMRASAAELVGLAPDVILVTSTAATKALQLQSQTVPIVFTTVNDPVTTGLVRNLARPESNASGFALYEPSIAGKWLELLKEAAPHVERVAHVFDPANVPETYFAAIEAAARTLAVQAVKAPVRDIVDIIRSTDAFATVPNGALLLPNDNTVSVHREPILRIAIQHRLPTIFANITYAKEGGLMAYGSDLTDQYRRAATYVDRLLRGAKVSELPVQFPTKFKLVVNLKTAKAIGLTIPEAFLLRADEVIE